ncbi:hypothetical protein SDC9_98622 [bioreactor metagenome]|uniref:Uncharacterized protein n=1 Tax=bioreactor metagenome TaxID=1076179 RepID=A0A645AHV8_9ZZZZ
MDTPVVHDIGFYHPFTVGFQYFTERMSQEIVTDVSQMKRFVGVGRRIFHHKQGCVISNRCEAEFGIFIDVLEQIKPYFRGNRQV